MKIRTLVLFLFAITISANNSFSEGISQVPDDKIFLATDRNLYIVTENILFSAYVFNSFGDISKVLYLEVVSPKGESIVSGKFSTNNRVATGSITIPNDILTGTYYIKAYTKWMRNFEVKNYFYSEIKIVNPYRKELRNHNSKNYEAEQLLSPQVIEIAIEKDQFKYPSRTKAMLKTKISQPQNKFEWANITVVPTQSIDSYYRKVFVNEPNSYDSTFYPAESLDISLSGRITSPNIQIYSKFKLVNLSILGAHSDFIATRTDSNGYFRFNLPSLKGKHELYIGVEETPNVSIKIDNDYCTAETNFNTTNFSLSENEISTVERMTQNIECQNLFNPANRQSKTTKFTPDTLKPFYGSPNKVFIFDKFINLLSIEEYFKELIPNVFISNNGEESSFRIFGNQPALSIYKPLLLVDLVAIDKAQRILEANPENFSRIEIISKPYYKGDMIFGGIISFFSKKGDMAGIELPPTDMFLEFDFFSSDTTQLPANIELPANIPDTRNTVLWIDNATDIINHNRTVEFFTPDTPGEYTILIRGLQKNGEFVTGSKTIIVE